MKYCDLESLELNLGSLCIVHIHELKNIYSDAHMEKLSEFVQKNKNLKHLNL